MRFFQRRAESSQGSGVWNHQHGSDLDFLTTVRALGVPISKRCDGPSALLRLVTVLNGKEASDASKLPRSIASAAPSHLVHQFTDRTSTAREQCRELDAANPRQVFDRADPVPSRENSTQLRRRNVHLSCQ